MKSASSESKGANSPSYKREKPISYYLFIYSYTVRIAVEKALLLWKQDAVTKVSD